ncbi:PKD domain-containing protein [Taibaiella chishuiensis]|uniref:Putative secreted protein (Por secretion system target) n=1 Tax=Taibaiella chishuiensis TaxID=1434707 RepID=A0A2P8D7A7_9BACT|nr:PKD domain-containing protein [Taibaiella chishuiensis]PSK93061.1 putative secreted protein (Por secretion system target) [Taibaiella chishuiensis]
MKKLFYLLLLTGMQALHLLHATTTPTLGQKQYRWRNNNGSETTATWRAAVNTPVTVASWNDSLRLRIELANTGSGAGAVTQTLEYSSNGGTTWTVMNNPATNAFTYRASSYVNNGAATTNQMGTGTAGTYAAGKIVTNPGTAVNLAANARTEYEWVIQPTANASPSTTYTFRSSGQQATPTVFPTLTMICAGKPEAGTIQAGSPVVACNTATTVALNGNTNGPGIGYQWQYNTGSAWTNFGSGLASESTPNITQHTLFRCVVTCSNGGDSDTTAEATIDPLPLQVNLGNDINRCLNAGASLKLDAGVFPNNPQYRWDDNSSGQMRDVSQSGVYSVRVTDQYTCTGTDTIKVTIRTNPHVALGNDTTICNKATLRLDAGPEGVSYFWSNGESTREIIINNQGSYIAFVTSNEGCIGSDTIQVTTAGELPGIQGISVQNNGQYTFKFTPVNPQYVIAYDWNFGDGSPHSTQQAPTHTYADNGNYIVVLKMQSSCGYASDSTGAVILGLNTLNIDMQELMIYPNPLRENAVIENRGALKMEQVIVYNLAGQQVYRAPADSKTRHNLQLQSLATGTYVVAIITDKGTVMRKIQLRP